MGQWDNLSLDRHSGAPLYHQLAEAIAERMARGHLAPGERLPASRELAQALGVNRATVTNAYDALASRGLVRSHVGQGTFVLEGEATGSDRLRFRFSKAVAAAGERVRVGDSELTHPDPIDFSSLVPDEELFPIDPFRGVLDDVLRKEGKTLLQYGPTAGHPPLRAYIAERLAERGVSATAANVIIVNGSQQALDLVCRTLLDPADRVAVESPTYTILLPLFAQYQVELDPIPMTDRGMDLDTLEASLARSRPRLVFTMPTFHNPTGVTMDVAARTRLVSLARRYEVPLVEDDFDSELRFAGEALPSLKALDASESVIHIGTFSKGLFPGLRLGWIVAPHPVVEMVGRAKLISDYHTSLLLQAAVLEFCRRGLYDEHLIRLTKIYGAKSRALTRAMEQSFPEGVAWTRPEGGYAFWVTLPERLSAEELLRESSKRGIFFTPGEHFFAQGGGRHSLRLSISRVPLSRIEEGVRELGRILKRMLRLEDRGRAERPRATEHEPALHI